MVENLEYIQRIAYLEETREEMESEIAERLSEMETARAQAKQQVADRDRIIDAWQEAYSMAMDKIERLQTDCDDMRLPGLGSGDRGVLW